MCYAALVRGVLFLAGAAFFVFVALVVGMGMEPFGFAIAVALALLGVWQLLVGVGLLGRPTV